MFRVDLRRLILALCLVAIVLTLGVSLFASYLTQRNILLDTTLQNNRVYARKLATLTEAMLGEIQDELGYHAKRIGHENLTGSALADTMHHMQLQTPNFNSLVAVSAEGEIIGESPALGLVGTYPDTARAKRALTYRQPILTEPFKTLTDRWVITQLSPIFRADGSYNGYPIGNIYLHEANPLQSLLGVHYFEDGSESYVVDRSGILIYHTNAKRIGEQIRSNPVIEALIRKEEGARDLINSQGVAMLAGYATVPRSGWGVVVQRQKAMVLARLDELTWRTVQRAAPLILITLLIIAWLASRIARPLHDMAELASTMEDPATPERLRGLKCWYMEAAQLRRALLNGLWAMHHRIRNLKHESATDPLSGLLNRRGLRAAIDQIIAERTPTAILVLDIDHFKKVNDTFGHSTGDSVIRAIAERMRRGSRPTDIVSRAGGEEFIILLPNTAKIEALRVAERLRLDVELTTLAGSSPVTISCGIAHTPDHAADADAAWRLAYEALYYAKRSGRNRCCIVDNKHPDGFMTAERRIAAMPAPPQKAASQ